MLLFCEMFLQGSADDCADGVRRVLLHLRCGVGVGIEGEACGAVAQGSGKGFTSTLFLRDRVSKRCLMLENRASALVSECCLF